jgi:hypothetical protein
MATTMALPVWALVAFLEVGHQVGRHLLDARL